MSNITVPWRPTVVWAGLALFISPLNEAGVAQGLPSISREFAVQLADLRWMMLGFFVAVAAVLIAGARLGDVLGRRRVFMAGLMIFAIGSIASSASINYAMLLSTRAVAGVGAGLFFAGLLAIITQAVPKEMLGRAFGLWAFVGAGAFIVSAIAGGMLAELASWRWIFVMNAMFALVVLALTPRFFGADAREGRTRLGDVRGLLAIGASMIALTVGLSEAPTRGWTSLSVMIAILLGVAAAFVAYLFERRAISPLVPAALFRVRGYLAGTAAITIGYGSVGPVVFAIPIVLYLTDGLSPISIGLIMLSYGIWWLVLPPFTGRLADRLGPAPMLSAGFAIGLIGCLLVTVVPGMQGIAGLCCGLALLGIGIAFIAPTSNRMTMVSVGPSVQGEASGVNMTARLLGYLAGVAIVGSLIASNLEELKASAGTMAAVDDLSMGLRAVWVPVGVLMALGLVVSAVWSRGLPGRPAELAEAGIGVPEDRG
jgi:MFS family permease